MPNVHHVPTTPGGGSYTLPQATESALGGVRGATQPQAEGASGTTILGWTNNRIRQLIRLIYTTAEKTKLAGIETNAQRNVGQQYTSTEKSKARRLSSPARPLTRHRPRSSERSTPTSATPTGRHPAKAAVVAGLLLRSVS